LARHKNFTHKPQAARVKSFRKRFYFFREVFHFYEVGQRKNENNPGEKWERGQKMEGAE